MKCHWSRSDGANVSEMWAMSISVTVDVDVVLVSNTKRCLLTLSQHWRCLRDQISWGSDANWASIMQILSNCDGCVSSLILGTTGSMPCHVSTRTTRIQWYPGMSYFDSNSSSQSLGGNSDYPLPYATKNCQFLWLIPIILDVSIPICPIAPLMKFFNKLIKGTHHGAFTLRP